MSKHKQQLNPSILDEIARLTQLYSIDSKVFENFAIFVLENRDEKPEKVFAEKEKSLKFIELKQAVYQYFEVKNTQELKKLDAFKMATSLWKNLNLSKRESWELIYRKYIDILPEEKQEQGKDCINGINIFKYFRPYQVFGLSPQTASKNDIKKAYYKLSKIYHPDNQATGNARIFDRLSLMYKSMTMEFK